MVTPGSYINLPSPGNKQAPKTFKGNHREVERFVAHFEYLCLQKVVVDPKEKCLGLVQYCSYDVADLIEGLEEYTSHNYDGLLKKFQHLYDSSRRKGEYHIGHIEEFTKAWRKEEIQTLEMFLQYHREFIQVAGILKTTGRIDKKEFCRGFWEGLNSKTRDRIERRMMDNDPALDLTVPFDTDKVVEAAEHIFNRNRFDKYLREGKPTRYDGEKKRGKKPGPRVGTDEEHSDKDTDEEDEGLPLWKRSKTHERVEQREKGAAVSAPTEKKRDEKDEINDLISKLDGLTIDQPSYRTTYVQLCLRAPKISDLYPRPTMPSIRSYAAVEIREPPSERMRRDLPPHQSLSQPERRFPERRFEERRDLTCFGCGANGHTMNQCAKLEALIDQGHIRRVIGKLRWADGSNIIKIQDEPWVGAVVRQLGQREQVPRAMDEREPNKGVYLIEVAREESDADSDEQEEMGWRSGTTSEGNLQALGAERTMRISKEAKQEADRRNLPQKTHRVRDLPSQRNLDKAGRKELGSIPKDADFNRGENRFEDVPAPVPHDVSPVKFKGELDVELVPMVVEEVPLGDRRDHGRKVLVRETKGNVGEIGQTGAKRGKAQSGVVNGILSLPLTLSLQEIASISPSVRRDLAMTLKSIRDDAQEELETPGPRIVEGQKKQGESALGKRRKEGGAKEVFLGNLERVGGREARGDLLRILITIGDATMVGVIDSGSMINMISARKLEESGLPSVALNKKSFKITGVNGGSSRCKSWLPGATIFVSKDLRETYGDVYVLEDADFEFIAGRPWSTLNGSRIEERERGTFVSWMTGPTRYEINASKTSDLAIRAAGSQVHLLTKEETEEPVAALTVRIAEPEIDQSCVPDSLESREELDYGGDEGGNQLGEGNQWEEGDLGSNGYKEDEEDYRPSPVLQNKGKGRQQEDKFETKPKKRTKKPRPSQRIIVDQDLEEGFSRLVQSGADKKEWEEFCGKESRRLARAEQRWFDWMDSDNEEYALPEDDGESSQATEEHETMSATGDQRAVPRNSPREESETQKTPPPSVAKAAKALPTKRKRSVSTQVRARRSSRVKTETTCSTCGGAPMNQRRAYQKRERAVRTISKKVVASQKSILSKEEDEGPKIRSYGLRVVPAEERKEPAVIKSELGRNKTNEQKDKGRLIPGNKQRGSKAVKRGALEPSPTSKKVPESRVTRPFLKEEPDQTPSRVLGKLKEGEWISNRPLTPSQAVEAWRKLTPVKQQEPADDDEGEGEESGELLVEVPTKKKADSKALINLYDNLYQEGQRMIIPRRSGGEKPQEKYRAYLTWDDGHCTLHVPTKRTKWSQPGPSSIRVPPECWPEECRTLRPTEDIASGPSVRNIQIPSQQLRGGPNDVTTTDEPTDRTPFRRLGNNHHRQNIRDKQGADLMTDEDSVSEANKGSTSGEAGANSPSPKIEGQPQHDTRTKAKSDERKRREDINPGVRSWTTPGSEGEDRRFKSDKGVKERRPILQSWRRKHPHPPKQPRLTSITRTSLLLLSLPLIFFLLAHLPTTTTTNYSGMNKSRKTCDRPYSRGSGLPEVPEQIEVPSSSGDPSVLATRLDEWPSSRDHSSGDRTRRKGWGIIEEPSVDRKNRGAPIIDEPTNGHSISTMLPPTLEKSDRVSLGPIPSNLGQGRMEEGDDDQDPNEVRHQIDLEYHRRKIARPRTLELPDVSLKPEREFEDGGVKPFSGKTETSEEKEGKRREKGKGKRPPPNSPIEEVKIGPPRSRRPGKKLIFENVATIEAKARAKEAARGKSEIRISFRKESCSPLPLEFWQNVTGLSTPTSASYDEPGTRSPSSSPALAAERPTEATPSSEEVLPQILEVLRKLRTTLGEALNSETRTLIHEVEVDTTELRDLQKRRENERDEDGDVMMEKEKGTHSRSLSPTYPLPSLEPGQISDADYAPRTTDREEEILRRIDGVEEEERTLQWKMINLEDHAERIFILEGRMKLAEEKKEGEPWTIVRPPTRRQKDGPITRSQSSAELATAKDMVEVRARMTRIEKGIDKATKGAENN